jgi:hypothetical protein
MVEAKSNGLPPWTKFLWNQTQITNPQPTFIEVDLTNYCNRNCKWCVSDKIRKEKPLNMSCDTFSRILEEAATNHLGIVFTGGGEPTLHPNFKTFCQSVMNLVNKGLIPQMGLITNGAKWDVVDWYLGNTSDPPAWVRISVNAWAIDDELKRLLKQYPNRIGISIIYDSSEKQKATDNHFDLSYGFKPKFIRMKEAHDFDHPTRDPESCLGRKFVKIYETDGSEPYCCLGRGLNGKPPKSCPSGCPWNFDIQDAWKHNPFS